ncbi:MAG: helix-turn-helix domain-containing protein [Sediminicola sp.]
MEDNKEYAQFRIEVPEEFNEVFSHFYHAANRSGNTITKTLLPSYQTILIFTFGNPALIYFDDAVYVKMDKCLVVGPIKRAFRYSLPINSEIFVANFRGDAFYRFFGKAEVAGRLPVHPDELLEESCFNALWEKLDHLGEASDRMHCILEFCKPYLGERNSIVEQLTNFGDAAISPIKYIADREKRTERSIQMAHKKHLGYSSREYNRYHRFLKAVKLIAEVDSTHVGMDWFKITETCGYYDQSQLIHDFKHYLQMSPTKYLKYYRDICDPTD